MDISSSHLNHSTIQERKQGLYYQKTLYILVAIELIIALVWTSFSVYWWPQLAEQILHWWPFGLVAGILCLILILLTFFFGFIRHFPINWVVYVLFTASFAHFISFLVCLDYSQLLFFSLWLFTAVILGFAIFSVASTSYIPIIESFLVAFGVGTIVLVAFIVLTNHSLYLLILVAVATSIVGFYYAYGLRTATRFSNFDETEDDPVSGAVRFWIDGALVGCRFFEMFGRAFKSRNY